ncbi:MAG: hypothetical protein MUO43_01785 [Desulfobacterales bacterium]|nr:hypothetical protein [Desulfobacterales bacterium]
MFEKEAVFSDRDEGQDPSIKGLQTDFRETMILAITKKKNPVSWYPSEVYRLFGGRGNIPGWFYQRKMKAHSQLAGMRYFKWTLLPQGGKKLEAFHASPYFKIEFPGSLGGAINTWIDPNLLKALNMETGELSRGQYKELPRRNPYSLRTAKGKAAEWLIRNVKGRRLKISAQTILKEKIGVTNQYYQRKEYCLKKICDWLDVARIKGFEFKITKTGQGDRAYLDLLQKYPLERIEALFLGGGAKASDPKFMGDCRAWEIEFFSPVNYLGAPSSEDKLLVKEIIHYLYYQKEFGIRNPEERTEKYLFNYIKKLGNKKVKEIFEEAKCTPLAFREEGGRGVNQAGNFFRKLKEETEKNVRK